MKPNRTSEVGQIIETENPIHVSNVKVIDGKKTSKKEEEGQMMNVNYYMEPMYYRGQTRDSMGRYTSGGRRGYDEPMYYDSGNQNSGGQ